MTPKRNISIPFGHCHCGCGESTKLAPYTCTRSGWRKGFPIKFIRGHSHSNTRRNCFSNTFLHEGEPVVGIPVSRGKFAIVDEELAATVSAVTWHYSEGYAVNDKIGKMHAFILKCKNGLEPDHKNGDRLDNRRSNLRPATRSQNAMNSALKSNNSSGVKGVSWNKERNKWEAKICVNYKQIQLGRFSSFESAVMARNKAEELYFGEFRRSGGALFTPLQ